MRIASVRTEFPRQYYDQSKLLEGLREVWRSRRIDASRAKGVDRLHRSVRVDGRHLALPIEAYPDLETFGASNDAWIEVAVDLGARATASAVGSAGLAVEDIDAFLFTTVTGVATPSIDARVMNRLGFRPDVRRTPMFGLGCMAGAAGIARAADWVRAYPRANALLLAVELCSLTLQRDDVSVANLIATGLFGDGAAAVVIVGQEASCEARGPRVVASRSVFYPDTEHIMGWEVSERGFRVVLSPDLPDLIRARLRNDVESFLAEAGRRLSDVDRWICHPGGPKVLESLEDALGLPPDALEASWESLRRIGNLSSASVLSVLGDGLERAPFAPGECGLLMALGPGFSAELVLLEG